MPIRCPECNKENADNKYFCICGQILQTVKCPKCGWLNNKIYRECYKCRGTLRMDTPVSMSTPSGETKRITEVVSNNDEKIESNPETKAIDSSIIEDKKTYWDKSSVDVEDKKLLKEFTTLIDTLIREVSKTVLRDVLNTVERISLIININFAMLVIILILLIYIIFKF